MRIEQRLFEELLRDGGNFPPRLERIGTYAPCHAEAAVGWHLRELPRKKISGQLVPPGFVDRFEQLPDPCAPHGGLGEIAKRRHGKIKLTAAARIATSIL
jgi:hypothetical protein